MTRPDVFDKASLGSLTPLGHGGQGTVYDAPRVRIDGNQPAVYKEYLPTLLPGLDTDALRAMTRLLTSLSAADGESLMRVAAWPLRLVRDHGRVTGFVMPRIPQRFWITMRLPGGAKQVRAETQHLLNSEKFLNTRGIGITDQIRCEILRDLAETLTVLHRHGIVVGDLSPKNLLFSLTTRPRCYLIDCDAMRLNGRSALPQAETPDWNVPNANEERATRDTDAYKLGLLAVRLFAGDQSTRDPANRRVPAELRSLARRNLSAQPAQRPKPSDWLVPLARAATAAALPSPPLNVIRSPAPTRPSYPSTQTAQKPSTTPAGQSVSAGLVAIAAVVFAALMIALVFFLQGHGPTDGAGASGNRPTPTVSAGAAARSVQLLLADSRPGRDRVVAGFAMVANCSDVAGGRRDITAALGNRQRLVARIRQLDLTALPRGAEIHQVLLTAFTASLTADRHYQNWANSIPDSCTAPAPGSPELTAAANSSKAATAAKRQFLALWRPVATTYNLPVPAEPDI